MKKTELTKQIKAISQNLKRLQNAKEHVEERKQKLLALKNTLHEEAQKCDFPEKKEIIVGSYEEIQSTVRVISKWIDEIDSEVGRVTLAYDAIGSNDIEVLRSALQAYVLSDTALSVKNITMGLYDFDQLIASTEMIIEKI
jgi:seryl-tRNA synthetase